ncbi:MAG: elongation factor P [Acidobacteriota bacterium]|jgi:elongation factor P
MIQATQIRKGMYIRHDNDLYRVVTTEHVTPGKGRGMVQAKIRHIKSGAIMDHRFRSGDRVDRVVLDETEMEYLYQDGDTFHFMNGETYEQVGLSSETLGDTVSYLIPNIRLNVQFWEGAPIGINPPLTVEMKVAETEPAIKGATVSNVGKPATMETGLIVQVPPFINEGDVIKVDTSSGAYVERVSK